MTLPEGVDAGFDGTFFANCLKEGVIYVPGEYAFATEPGSVPRNHLRLSFGVPGESDLVEGARRLSAALDASLSP
jgi:2-aminoadipate transaminase